ncbi:DNA-binding CsgD family transcriptional regulator [Allocatelliglobosispora scoriae]|uniref:DNA-binding CsgD family transcriptional regulator n=1 Tax=Allocatelliglobosispora scoriae TaxID=643052 RepID=A0A841BLW1_9ACTN|nr:helix-turn-helix transcriptional regulator [Allocatelliglobosispora scoriae]MBB5867810.1 DNA-binding CsgD family transcriptional regulator [Allocatelliglobosispora scoriae]
MFRDVEAERLLSAARHTADPVAAARLATEAFLELSRTADPDTLSPLVRRLAGLRSEPPRAQTEALFHTVAGVVAMRTRQSHAARHLDAAIRLIEQRRLHDDPLFLECAVTCTLTVMRPHEVRPRYAHLIAGLDTEPARRARLVALLGLGDAWSGGLLRGRTELKEAVRLARAAERTDIEAEAMSWLAKVEALCGDLPAAADALLRTRDLAARAGSSWVAFHITECAAALHLASGDQDAWLGVLENVVATHVGATSGLVFEHRWELATHYALHDRAADAAALLTDLPEPPLAWPGAPVLPAWRAWISDPADISAMAGFEAALAGLNQPVERLSRARMAWLLGSQHARLGRRADAFRLLESASAAYASMGAAGLLARVTDELDRIAPGSTPSLLTTAETRVARAVAGGLSNPETAQLLGVSARTVEFHLGNVFRKLGVRNRTELVGALGPAVRP